MGLSELFCLTHYTVTLCGLGVTTPNRRLTQIAALGFCGSRYNIEIWIRFEELYAISITHYIGYESWSHPDSGMSSHLLFCLWMCLKNKSNIRFHRSPKRISIAPSKSSFVWTRDAHGSIWLPIDSSKLNDPVRWSLIGILPMHHIYERRVYMQTHVKPHKVWCWGRITQLCPWS